MSRGLWDLELYNGIVVGEYNVDILVEGTIIIGLKAI